MTADVLGWVTNTVPNFLTSGVELYELYCWVIYPTSTSDVIRLDEELILTGIDIVFKSLECIA